ncbi:tRNA (N6-threonylcarbamoyladenosine(37)-N6)-methyltransferase TrmO [Marinospirillum alkaliphilum]|uniref:tRNA-Thr(GGU) m(6)t(6)A37 methyltransferase TsaA n=1 Tax=Marinospirillum alkaliphilum DSM 21637 TaxID=1122209 RepID=A0A1K1W1W5_9GAMM|nr:tRNA (N6-threonylcarbamoyladenosine(37)-N6)-methyltransferase TrmO [Marinospirillum alkaliphilum]SFX30805.1 tRNA-Thr(GGU) m(6)t(6)A37 methyltransferase TsaA [Marinospirillum alkaliphilum DSM 21637]
MSWSLEPIGILHSCYKEKFAVPRQPGLAPSAYATLELLPPYNQPLCVEGLEQFSHLWLTFVFHQNLEQGWKARVRPPRLGGNKKIGVFASRSTFRPNGLGLSVVKLEGVDCSKGVKLQLSGIDLVDGTPIVDIKPYLPWADSLPQATAGWAPETPALLSVHFSPLAEKQLTTHKDGQQLKQLLIEVLSQNPRPAYQQTDPERIYGVLLADLDVRFRYPADNRLEVTELLPGRS